MVTRINDDVGVTDLAGRSREYKLPKVFPGLNLFQVIYAVLSFIGAVILQMGADSISN
jgi:hypothetical protein